MDLDYIKKTWQQVDIESSIGEDKIQMMLDNKGQGALARLIRYEKFFLCLMVLCVLFGALFYILHPVTGIIYSITLVISFFWQSYKIKYLKNIDVSTMGILEVSKRITRYRQYITYEIIAGTVFALIFFSCYIFFAMPEFVSIVHHKPIGNQIPLFELVVSFVASLLLFAIIVYLIYRFMYIKNIRSIRKSIKEVEDFEQDK